MIIMEKEDIATLIAIHTQIEELNNELAYIISKHQEIPKEFQAAKIEEDTYPDSPEVTEEDYDAEYIKLGELSKDMENITVRAEVTVINPVSTFTKKDGSEGRVRNITLYDKTGSVVVPLWNKQVTEFKDLMIGDILEVNAWKVTEYKGVLQLKLGKSGHIRKLGHASGQKAII